MNKRTPDFRGYNPSLFSHVGGEISVSFEFFPPATPEMEQRLWSAITTLAPLKPGFVSVTYGAGGSTRTRTHNTIKRILKETALVPAAHLTCVGAKREEIDAVVRDYWALGVRHMVALRGDPPEGTKAYAPHPGGYANAAELVAGIKAVAPFDVSVACYPDVHPDSRNRKADLDNLKAKVEAGADRAITQFFFEADHYFRFVDAARAHGIQVPIVPGILPVNNVKQLKRFAGKCGMSIPKWLDGVFDGLDDLPETRNLVAATIAGELVKRLNTGGVADFHFYTLNRADLTFAICRLLGLRPQEASRA
ncbi:MAG TPA: methylenetetrahydrofolate reductase [NAD(P)H] [Sphingomonadales bacterium]|nr:methylenetetrahydrofolate reductase [NAD(P)H] [Sphingomonadales bacterium]